MGLSQFYKALTLPEIFPGLFPVIPWPRAAVELLALYGSGLVLTHLLRQYMRRHRWDTLRALALAPRIVLASLILGIPLGIPFKFMSVSVLNVPTPEGLTHIGIVVPDIYISPLTRTLLDIVNWSLLFAIWTSLYFMVLRARKRRLAKLRQSELERALQQAELRLLKSQLNPHFLFNSINSVRALIAEDPALAQGALTRLARTLRYTLGSGKDELVTLEQELDIVSDYLALESLLLGDRLRIERDVSPDALRARIPVMLLQTVVENAVKHGIAELEAGGVLQISANVHGGALRLTVENSRPASPPQSAHEGVGLRNAAERLRLLFGAEASLDLDLSAPERAVARIRIPVRQ